MERQNSLHDYAGGRFDELSEILPLTVVAGPLQNVQERMMRVPASENPTYS